MSRYLKPSLIASAVCSLLLLGSFACGGAETPAPTAEPQRRRR